MNEIPSLGQVAFEAYCDAVGGQTFDGKPIPGWNELHGDRLKVQGGWEAAAQAIRQHVQMMAALDATADRASADFRERQQPRWLPLSSVREVPDSYSTAPGGAGEPPTGRRIAVAADDRDDDSLPDALIPRVDQG